MQCRTYHRRRDWTFCHARINNEGRGLQDTAACRLRFRRSQPLQASATGHMFVPGCGWLGERTGNGPNTADPALPPLPHRLCGFLTDCLSLLGRGLFSSHPAGSPEIGHQICTAQRTQTEERLDATEMFYSTVVHIHHVRQDGDSTASAHRSTEHSGSAHFNLRQTSIS